ncbi:MAG: PEPxxWA-CTERM sorting domain-containing protein [Patescibacteria group bacterium]
MKKLLVSALAAAALAASVPASAAIMVMTYTGVIETGNDHIGFYGVPGADLAGLRFKTIFTIDTSVNRFQPDVLSDSVVGPSYPEATSTDNPFLSATVVVNGGTPFALMLFDTSYAYVDPGSLIHESGLSAEHPWFFSVSDPGISNLDVPFSIAGSLGSGSLTFYDGLGNSAFDFVGRVTQASSVVQGGAVPEPATWALMILGFGSAGAMLRRRRAIVA